MASSSRPVIIATDPWIASGLNCVPKRYRNLYCEDYRLYLVLMGFLVFTPLEGPQSAEWGSSGLVSRLAAEIPTDLGFQDVAGPWAVGSRMWR